MIKTNDLNITLDYFKSSKTWDYGTYKLLSSDITNFGARKADGTLDEAIAQRILDTHVNKSLGQIKKDLDTQKILTIFTWAQLANTRFIEGLPVVIEAQLSGMITDGNKEIKNASSYEGSGVSTGRDITSGLISGDRLYRESEDRWIEYQLNEYRVEYDEDTNTFSLIDDADLTIKQVIAEVKLSQKQLEDLKTLLINDQAFIALTKSTTPGPEGKPGKDGLQWINDAGYADVTEFANNGKNYEVVKSNTDKDGNAVKGTFLMKTPSDGLLQFATIGDLKEFYILNKNLIDANKANISSLEISADQLRKEFDAHKLNADEKYETKSRDYTSTPRGVSFNESNGKRFQIINQPIGEDKAPIGITNKLIITDPNPSDPSQLPQDTDQVTYGAQLYWIKKSNGDIVNWGEIKNEVAAGKIMVIKKITDTEWELVGWEDAHIEKAYKDLTNVSQADFKSILVKAGVDISLLKHEIGKAMGSATAPTTRDDGSALQTHDWYIDDKGNTHIYAGDRFTQVSHASVDLSQYFTKAETNTLLDGKADKTELTNKANIDLANVVLGAANAGKMVVVKAGGNGVEFKDKPKEYEIKYYNIHFLLNAGTVNTGIGADEEIISVYPTIEGDDIHLSNVIFPYGDKLHFKAGLFGYRKATLYFDNNNVLHNDGATDYTDKQTVYMLVITRKVKV